MINLKLDPQNIELKEPKKIGSFKVKIHIHPMLETPIISILKKYHKIMNYKKVRQIIIWYIY